MKKILILLLVLLFASSALFGCDFIGGKEEPKEPENNEQGGGEGEKDPILISLNIPNVTISSDGVARWQSVFGATSYMVIVGETRYYQSENYIQLKPGESIRVSALGDGVTCKDSAFSDVQYYIPATPTEKTPLCDMADAPYDQVYTVEGIVCAAGAANLLLTDNDGSYLYVYTEYAHGHKIGDKIRVSGTKTSYWNAYELKDITADELISSDNEIETPFVIEGDSEFFKEKLDDFTVGECVTVTGRLQISGSYYNFAIEGLDDALLSLAYDGEPLEDGKLYTVTGYLTFISGSTARYINVIVSEINEYTEGKDPLLCESCGKPVSEGEHHALGCGHFACEGGDHTELDCGHYFCEAGEHTRLDCEHYACEGGDHTLCEYCGGYLCRGDHTACGQPVIEYCETCGQPLGEGEHNELECGHYSCEAGEHTKQSCGHYLCLGEHEVFGCGHYSCDGGEHYDLSCGHSACEDGDHSSCIYCGDYFCDGEDHSLLECGHFACQDGNHVLLSCGHYECEGGDHTLFDCGHCASTPGGHGKCDACGKNLCTGDHSDCGEPIINYCNICGKNYEIGEHGMLGCGHYACEDGNHDQCPCCPGYICTGDHSYRECGHPVCTYENLNHEICPSCGNYSCLDRHDALECGHHACEDGEHRECMTCLGYLCKGDHSVLDCGHRACAVGEHKKCSACSSYLCFGNHELLDCGHRACESCEMMLCPYCGEYLCNGKNHTELPCGHYSCEGGNHTKLDCEHYACEGGNHTPCEYCGGFVCRGDHTECGKPILEYCEVCGKPKDEGSHGKLSCGHYSCDGKEHTKLSCGHYSCDGKEHTKLSCGHYSCDGKEHTPCEICEKYICNGEHGEGICVKTSTFPEIMAGEDETVFTTEGIVCAVGAYEFMMTDNIGNYLHVAFDRIHPFEVGDKLRVTGYKFEFGNVSYELVPINIEVLNKGNEIITPNKVKVYSSYFSDGAENGYKMGEYISFKGSFDYYSECFKVGDVSVGVVWTGVEVFHDEEYIISAYVYYLNEIDGYWVIATDFHKEYEICPVCTYPLAYGDHTELLCGHFACEGGDHDLLECGHFTCQDGDHDILKCGHYACFGGNHDFLNCGHFACEAGEHYMAGCGHYVCLYGKHYLFDCGHWSCEGGTHSHCGYCGGYLCIGDHSECEEEEEIYCEICGGILNEGDHYLLVCGHYACEDGDHTECTRCGEYYCEGGDHYQLPCGHLFCEEGKHNIADCKMHYVCHGGDHSQLPCGHFECQGGNHNICGYCGGYLCRGDHDHKEYCSYCGAEITIGNHSELPCGHHACQDGNHEQCSFCGGYFCHGGTHSICYGCRSAVCDGNEHNMCPICGWYLCRGDHSVLECGHYACDGGSHYPCDICGEYLCLGGNHYLLDCGHYVCDGGIHKYCTACGEYTCNAPDHMLCTLCNEPACIGIHKTCPGCGEVTCNRADHSICDACGNRLCVGDHTECVVEGYFCEFDYSVHVGFSVDNYFLENDEISRPLIRLISNGYTFEKSLTLKFVPSDGGRFVLTAGFDFLGLAWIDEYTFSGTFENVGLLYRINITEASRYNASTGETEDMMQFKGTYFPFTTEDYIMVNDETHTFEIDKYELLYFILSEQYDLPPHGDICYFCNQEVTDDNIPIHIYICDDCGKHYCEGGVTEHLFYSDETGKAEHYPVSDEEKRWDVKLPGDVVVNPSTPMPSEKEGDEE